MNESIRWRLALDSGGSFINQSINQSSNQSTNQSTNQSINQIGTIFTKKLANR